jgi:hypothetical protein
MKFEIAVKGQRKERKRGKKCTRLLVFWLLLSDAKCDISFVQCVLGWEAGVVDGDFGAFPGTN